MIDDGWITDVLSHNDEAGCQPSARNMPPNPITSLLRLLSYIHWQVGILRLPGPPPRRQSRPGAGTEPEPGSG